MIIAVLSDGVKRGGTFPKGKCPKSPTMKGNNYELT